MPVAKNKDRTMLDQQAAKNIPDLEVLEDRLGWTVEGVKRECLL